MTKASRLRSLVTRNYMIEKEEQFKKDKCNPDNGYFVSWCKDYFDNPETCPRTCLYATNREKPQGIYGVK